MITLRTPGALLIASQGDCAALTITALIATSTDAATGPPTAGAAPTGAPLFTVGITPSPPRGSVVGIDMIAANSGVTVGVVGSVGGATTSVVAASVAAASAAAAASVAAAAEASVAAASVAAAAAASVAAASVADALVADASVAAAS